MSPYTLSRSCITILYYCKMFSLRGNYVFLYILRGIWWYLQVTIIDLSSPIGASLYNIGTRICSQRTTSSSSKCRGKIRWQRHFINNEYEGGKNKNITGNSVGIWHKFNRGSNHCVKNVQYCRAHSWTVRNDNRHDFTKKKVSKRNIFILQSFLSGSWCVNSAFSGQNTQTTVCLSLCTLDP